MCCPAPLAATRARSPARAIGEPTARSFISLGGRRVTHHDSGFALSSGPGSTEYSFPPGDSIYCTRDTRAAHALAQMNGCAFRS